MNCSNSFRKTKTLRKLGKYHSVLKNDFGISPSKYPQKNIVLCNGGLASGISKEDIVELFSQFGILENVVLIAKKSFAFITFKEISCAIVCFDRINGKCYFPQLSGPMCLLFVEKVPNSSPFDTSLPPGSILYKDFITAKEESAFLETINVSGDEWQPLKHRKVKHFGYEFVYGENSAKKNEGIRDIPSICDGLWNRITNKGWTLPWIPDQLTVNCYEPGQGIPPHVDTHSTFEDNILIISLGADTQMEFKNEHYHSIVHLPRRSLLILSGESRYTWSHGISSRDRDVYFDKDLGYVVVKRGTRTSLTFRRIRQTPCDCKFVDYCDSRVTDSNVLQEESAVELENKYVGETYSNIADHFSLTRYKPWPQVLEFVQDFPVGSLVLDVGCGNGKYFGYRNNIFEVGSELCSSLALICRKRGFETVNNNCLSLPFKDNIFDRVICIAVLHHLCTLKRRQRAINELVRVLRHGGRALVYVWAEKQNEEETPEMKQEYDYQENGSAVGINVKLNSIVTLPVIANNGKNFKRKDILVPWRTNEDCNNVKTFLRYYHIFEEKELIDLCLSVGGKVLNTYYDTGNWCIIFSK
ncbi:tRNA (carboxymethyluridine(34)-5-O)-methyltransferase alkbh8 [Rhodnius prolixus]|uniref:tRNA (carboxymethyluridine(34)-5-O)-methyltransferase alkbh8 n=1 Tax=Rhodnius prolixus TaxID=13249 RepID=UPI003D1897E5